MDIYTCCINSQIFLVNCVFFLFPANSISKQFYVVVIDS